MSGDKILEYKDVVAVMDKPEVFLIDVREPSELHETGTIPSSINIPLGEMAATLDSGKAEVFKKKYGRDLPKHDALLIFFCKTGNRGTKGMEQAVNLGFAESKVYKAGLREWKTYH